MVLNVVGSNPTGHPSNKEKRPDCSGLFSYPLPLFYISPSPVSLKGEVVLRAHHPTGRRFAVLRMVLLRLFPYNRFVLLYKRYIFVILNIRI